MALVLLPCDLPTWPTVQRHLNQLKQAQTSEQLLDGMQKLHNLCCVGLDPDEDQPDPHRFDGLKKFVDDVLNEDERKHFFDVTLPVMIKSSLRLKLLKPINGLHFSLQQQSDRVSIDRQFVMSLMANAFFSTFPRRTRKTHPTLQDFNFSQFFAHLDKPYQQGKLRCFFHYFDCASNQEPKGRVTYTRQVALKGDSPSLDEWLKCERKLCPIIVRNEGGIEDAEEGVYQVCFASPRIGGDVFTNGCNQEELMFMSSPELLLTLLYCESLEANEVLAMHGWDKVGVIKPDGKFIPIDRNSGSYDTHLCSIDADNFTENPKRQYRNESVLQELSKAFLGFRQPEPFTRLSPIGESCSSTPPEMTVNKLHEAIESFNKEGTTAVNFPLTKSENSMANRTFPISNEKTAVLPQTEQRPFTIGQSEEVTQRTLDIEAPSQTSSQKTKPVDDSVKILPSDDTGLAEKLALSLVVPSMQKHKSRNMSDASELSYRDAFSSTQTSFCSTVEESWFTPQEPNIPISISSFRPLTLQLEGSTTNPTSDVDDVILKSVSADQQPDVNLSDEDDEYQSCSEEFDEQEDTEKNQESPNLISTVGRQQLAATLRGAILSNTPSEVSDVDEASSVALDIHISGPDVHDKESEIRVRRAPSTGFRLDEDEEDQFNVTEESLKAERHWLANFRQRSSATSRSSMSRRNSSRYSFSSEFSSDMDDIYEHFEEMMSSGPVSDDPNMAKYVGGLLKRTLSDSLTAATAGRLQSESKLTSETLPRSHSLAEQLLAQEHKAFQEAKKQVGGVGPKTIKHSNSAPEASCIQDLNSFPNSSEAASGKRKKLSGQLVSIVIEQSLAEVEEHLKLKLPKAESEKVCKNLKKLFSNISVSWNYNSTYDFDVNLDVNQLPDTSADNKFHQESHEDSSSSTIRQISNMGSIADSSEKETLRGSSEDNSVSSSMSIDGSPRHSLRETNYILPASKLESKETISNCIASYSKESKIESLIMNTLAKENLMDDKNKIEHLNLSKSQENKYGIKFESSSNMDKSIVHCSKSEENASLDVRLESMCSVNGCGSDEDSENTIKIKQGKNKTEVEELLFGKPLSPSRKWISHSDSDLMHYKNGIEPLENEWEIDIENGNIEQEPVGICSVGGDNIGLRKWEATSNLCDGNNLDLLNISSKFISETHNSKSVECVNSGNWSMSDSVSSLDPTDKDPDQFWIILDNELEDTSPGEIPRKRTHSFMSFPSIQEAVPLSQKAFTVDDLTSPEEKVYPKRCFGTFNLTDIGLDSGYGSHFGKYNTLQTLDSIFESRETEESSSPSQSEKIDSPKVFSPPFPSSVTGFSSVPVKSPIDIEITLAEEENSLESIVSPSAQQKSMIKISEHSNNAKVKCDWQSSIVDINPSSLIHKPNLIPSSPAEHSSLNPVKPEQQLAVDARKSDELVFQSKSPVLFVESGKPDGLRKDLSDLFYDPEGVRPIATGNWGCGRFAGDPQLKAMIQWLAASKAQVPYIIYYTQGNQNTIKLDIVCRILQDRKWTVGTLMQELLKYCQCYISQSQGDSYQSLFDSILPHDMN